MTHRSDARPALEAIVDEIVDSYALGREIDSLESAALPNRRKVVEALHHLEYVAFLGFYSTGRLSAQNLRQHLADHVHAAAGLLTEQIARAVVYARRGGPAPEGSDIQWSRDVVEQVFARIPCVREQLSLDVRAAYQGDPAAKSIEEIVFSYPAIQAITVYRIAHELFLRDVPMVPRIMTEHAHSKTGIEIHPGARIGRSFFIDHGTGVVIGATALIGDCVKLYQGVTLGALSVPRVREGEKPKQRHPTLEDNVTIYAGATILGGETVIGEGAVIGSNCWITKSVAPGARITFTVVDTSQG
jgi:serine O-acetyltransferase